MIWLARIIDAALHQGTKAPAAPPWPSSVTPKPISAHVSQAEVDAGAVAVRKMIDATGYGHFVTDRECWEVALSVCEAAAQARAGP